MTLGSQMVVVGGKAKDLDEARQLLEMQFKMVHVRTFRTFLENQDGCR